MCVSWVLSRSCLTSPPAYTFQDVPELGKSRGSLFLVAGGGGGGIIVSTVLLFAVLLGEQTETPAINMSLVPEPEGWGAYAILLQSP